LPQHLEEGIKLAVSTIHSLSSAKWKALKEFIWPTLSFYRASILFDKKKDGLLHLYVDFYNLNYITKKN